MAGSTLRLCRRNHSRKQRNAVVYGGASDHVHLLAKLSPTITVSDMLRLIKTNSSKMVNENVRTRIPFQWQAGYAAFSVSESQHDPVQTYILNQEEHHRKTTFTR